MFRLTYVIGLIVLCQLTAYSSGTNRIAGRQAAFTKKLTVQADLYKDIVPRQLQRTTDARDLKIIVPDDPQWKSLGASVAGLLKQRWNTEARVDTPDPQRFTKGWAGNTIILGNLGNNKQMARLYGLRISYADAVYPGKGGYQLLTVIDPFGLGGNTIVVGASEINGAKEGVARLLDILKKTDTPAIPWILQARLSEETSNYFGKSGQLAATAWQTLKRLKPIKDSETIANGIIEVLSQIKQYGEYYLLTGNPEFGEVYSILLKEYARFVNQYPDAAMNQLESRRNMWIQGEKLFQLWNVLEADPLFTQLERSQILSALYLTCEANANDGYLVRAPAQGPRWNHEIFPAVSLSGSCYYFEKYHPELSSEVLKWKDRGDRIFTGNTSYISLDEGSDYLVHVPMVNIDYAMATGQLRFIDQSLRPSADLHAMMIDNLGTMSGGGDTYPFGMSSAYSWGHSQVMYAASWYYNDPIYNFLLERTRTGPFPGQKKPDLNYPVHRYMVASGQAKELVDAHYPKVQAQQIEPGVYDDLKTKETLTVKQQNAFHKLTFRSGFGLDDNYLILDGFSAGRHGHQDGNTILNYSANGRLFLNDRDYIQNTPDYHSGVVIVKDGEQYKKPPLAKLEWVGDIEGTGISRTSIPDYNGTDWSRTIISPGGKFFIIYDDLKINKPGNFLIRNLWQSLGTPQIQQNTFSVEQKGVTMQLQSMTDADLRLKDIYGHFIKYWKTVYPYPYADHETVLTEVITEKKYNTGDKTGFINILSSHKGNQQAVQAIPVNETTVAITDGSSRWLAVKGNLENEVLSSNGGTHLLGNDELIAASVTRIKLGTQQLNFAAPVIFKLNAANGKWKTYGLLKNKVKYNDHGDPLLESAIDSGALQWNRSDQQRLEQLITNNKTTPKNAPAARVTPVTGWKKHYAFNGQVTSSAAGDLNGDGRDELLIAGSNGTVKAIDAAGKLLWSFKAKGRINEISVQYAGVRPLVFIATENWYIQALNAQGREQWNYKFPDDAAHREYKGNLIGITTVRLAYPHGKDREPSVMVGTQFRYLYELDLNGKLKHDTMLYFYGIEDMEYADLDGDGKEEGLFALEYYYYTLIKDGKLLTGKTGGPGWKVADVLYKNHKDSIPSMLLGSKQSEIRRIGYKGDIKEFWIKNVGGEVNDIRHGDFNNDGQTEILVGTEGFQFYVLNTNGATIFRNTLQDRVLKADGYRQNGKARYLAAAAQGWLTRFSERGNTEQTVQFPHEVSNIVVANNHSLPWIILENGDVYSIDQ